MKCLVLCSNPPSFRKNLHETFVRYGGEKQMSEQNNSDDYDSPWKNILESYFEEFMQFFFPDAAKDIDWSPGYEFWDKEL